MKTRSILSIGGKFVKKFLFMLISLFGCICAMAMVNINTATVRELETLPSIGPVKAKAIEDYRREHGHFKSKEEIIKVKGIGQATFGKLKDHISVEDSAKAPSAFSGSKPKYAVPATAIDR